MLTTPTQAQRYRAPRRPARSLKQEYQEFLLQRIEEYKNAIPRDELLQIGDEAVRELQTSAQDQYLLTEVLLLEHVDRVIQRRLRLPTFPRWKQKHRALREAQREPTHWGLDPAGPVIATARRLEAGDIVVVVGASALPVALFIAAHEVEVFLLDQDLGAIEAAEQRAVTEQLAGRVQALVVQFGGWLPDLTSQLVVIDPHALGTAHARERVTLMQDLQTRTPPGGVHIVLPVHSPRQVIPLAPESLQAHYSGWEIERRRRAHPTAGFLATKPASERQHDTALNVSD